MKKKVYLIGLNLYSIFLSLKIRSDFKELDVIILEGSNNFLKAYNSIKIGKYSVNPGFHTLEDVRSKSLLDFLKKITKFKKLKKTRGMIIGNNLISYQDKYESWPKEIKKKFKIKKKIYNHKNNKNFNYSDKRYIKYLKDCFSDKRTSFDDAIKLSYPWFFPPNYKRNSRDEDSIFNQKIRDKKIIHKYVFPAGGLFKDISKGLRKLLKQRGIKMKEKVVKFLKDNGYNPYDPSVHFCGVPTSSDSFYGQYITYIRDPRSMNDYYDGYIITTNHVLRGYIRDPYNYNNWVITSKQIYNSPESLLELLPKVEVAPKSCWE